MGLGCDEPIGPDPSTAIAPTSSLLGTQWQGRVDGDQEIVTQPVMFSQRY